MCGRGGVRGGEDVTQRQEQAIDNQLWFSLNAIVGSAANVSKHLWPLPSRRSSLKKALPKRGEELRASLGVTDDSPLRSNQVRNNVEHADEKLEEWFLDHPDGVLVKRLVGLEVTKILLSIENSPSTLAVEPPTVDPARVTVHEVFDTERFILYVLGDAIKLVPVIWVLGDIYIAADDGTDPFIQEAVASDGEAAKLQPFAHIAFHTDVKDRGGDLSPGEFFTLLHGHGGPPLNGFIVSAEPLANGETSIRMAVRPDLCKRFEDEFMEGGGAI